MPTEISLNLNQRFELNSRGNQNGSHSTSTCPVLLQINFNMLMNLELSVTEASREFELEHFHFDSMNTGCKARRQLCAPEPNHSGKILHVFHSSRCTASNLTHWQSTEGPIINAHTLPVVEQTDF